MRRTTRLTALLGATALTMALAACGGDGGGGAAPAPESNALDDVEGVTDVTFWHSMDGSNGEALQGLVDQFNADNEGKIAVEAVFQGGYDDTITKYKASVQSGSTPDLVQIYDIGTRFMIDSEQVVPMQEFIDRDDYDVSDLQPNIAGYYSVDDSLWSMPFNTSMPVLYYNKTMFEAAGLDPEKAPSLARGDPRRRREAVGRQRRAGRVRFRRSDLRLADRAVRRLERRRVLRRGQRPRRQGDGGALRRARGRRDGRVVAEDGGGRPGLQHRS